ncbi:hypothetical protein GCM10025857_24720 [Alicyclobacillus contaminans]|uniref:Rossmann-like and DUF2520 domain-containing protein n=1 Tax=Alicyclobacillus contaminans TaxID=392016 RepID=UPI00041B652C|nr:Rossmann-like and DUF2520 domain-containing protein [Alicyclobacillus contaminans]GMA51115.1 hypothetical protein GCM10025857_24720 [Alicyclobacillus contaminans]
MNFAVLGPGKMGTALTLALMELGHTAIAACARTGGTPASQRFMEATGVPVVPLEAFSDAVRRAEMILLTVPDKAVTPMAQTLADTGWIRGGQLVVHTAGSLSANALGPVMSLGAAALCMHPLQTIARPELGAALFRGIHFTLDGHPNAVAMASDWIHAWGGTPLPMDPEQRPAYHAAAVLASNALVALAAVAAEVSGLPDGLRALLPLLRGAVDNLSALGLPDALTGPIERGDTATIEAHLRALQNNPTALSVYAALGKATADVAFSKGSLTPTARETLRHRFENILGGM